MNNAERRRLTYGSRSAWSRDSAAAAQRIRPTTVRSLLLSGGRRLVGLLAAALWSLLGAAGQPLRYVARRQACHRRTKEGLLVFQPPMYYRVRGFFTPERMQRAQLLEWAQAQLPYFTVHNFSSCWEDGITLCALMDALRPGCCRHYASLKPSQRVPNCELGLRLAVRHLRVPEGVVTAAEMSQSASDFKVYQLLLMMRHQAEQVCPPPPEPLPGRRRKSGAGDKHRPVGGAVDADGEVLDEDEDDAMSRRATRQLVRQCSARGAGLQSAAVGRPAKFTVQLPTANLASLGEGEADPADGEGDSVCLIIRGPPGATFRLDRLPSYCCDGRRRRGGEGAAAAPIGQMEPSNSIRVTMQYLSSDRFQIIWYPSTDGEHEVSIRYRGNHVNGSPFAVYCRTADPLAQLNDLRLLDEGLGSANIEKIRQLRSKLTLLSWHGGGRVGEIEIGAASDDATRFRRQTCLTEPSLSSTTSNSKSSGSTSAASGRRKQQEKEKRLGDAAVAAAAQDKSINLQAINSPAASVPAHGPSSTLVASTTDQQQPRRIVGVVQVIRQSPSPTRVPTQAGVSAPCSEPPVDAAAVMERERQLRKIGFVPVGSCIRVVEESAAVQQASVVPDSGQPAKQLAPIQPIPEIQQPSPERRLPLELDLQVRPDNHQQPPQQSARKSSTTTSGSVRSSALMRQDTVFDDFGGGGGDAEPEDEAETQRDERAETENAGTAVRRQQQQRREQSDFQAQCSYEQIKAETGWQKQLQQQQQQQPPPPRKRHRAEGTSMPSSM